MDSDLANIGQQYREKLEPFITHAELSHTLGSRFYPIEINDFYRSLDFYVSYPGTTSVVPLLADRMSSMDTRKTSLSPLTSPTIYNPVVVFEGEQAGFINEDVMYPSYRIYPDTSTTDNPTTVELHYIRTPKAPNWVGNTIDGQIVPFVDDVNYHNFELHQSDYSEVVDKVLLYFGLEVRDPEVIQVAGTREQQNAAV